ncbi:MAG: ABC transporter permease, partial [Clostridia bacterium]|nr:ABC transporter permease [Clostridia bacterium]
KAPILAIWAIGKISSTSIEWTSATLITVAVMIGAIGLVVGLCYPKFKRIQKLTDALNEITRESITGVRVVRAFNAEDYQENKFEKVNTAVTSNQLFTSRAMGVMMPVMTVCMSGLTLAIYWIGAVLMNKAAVLDRAVVLGDMTAFTQYALQVVMAFMMLVMIFVIMPRAMVSSKRINEVLGKGAKTYDNNLPAGDIAGLCYPADATVRLDIEGGAAELDVALKSICARVVKTVELDGVTIVYAYSPRVCAEPLPLAEGGYNVMAA